jgi:translation initiation factor IF-2
MAAFKNTSSKSSKTSSHRPSSGKGKGAIGGRSFSSGSAKGKGVSSHGKDTGRKKEDASSLKKAEGSDKAPAVKIEEPKILPTLSLIEEKSPRPQRTGPIRRVLPRIGVSKEPDPVPEVFVELATEETASEPLIEVLEERKIIHIKPPIMIKELAAQMEIKPFKVIHDLMEMNIFANINQSVEPEVATKLCERYGFLFEREKRVAGAGMHKVEVVVAAPLPLSSDETKSEGQVTRAPIITFMGHVDHGKTSLLDAIRRTKVASGEVGGITQRMGAYMIEKNGHPITFIDTPGHAAFTAMRARGANITDIVVLVVAADDGLMPQTLEALSHARAANVTIMVAINKIDLPAANVDRVKAQLQEQGLVPEDWGGDTVCCEVSAATGKGIDQLLEMMLLQAEMLELKADPDQPARASVIEAQVEAGRGPTAAVIINTGTLRVGDAFICGNYWGKLKQLTNDLGQPVKEAPPAMPVKVLGLSGLPNAGDELIVMDSERSARQLSEERLESLRSTKLAAPQRTTLENLFKNLAAEQKKVLHIILKADMQGALEAIVGCLGDIPKNKVDLKIIHAGVGPISESDVLLATTSNAVIIGFSVKVENTAATTARREGIQIKLYSIIYELIDQMREAMAGLLDPELREAVVGHATVKQVFELTRGIVAGCQVTDGRIARTARARILRRRQAVYDGGIGTLRRFTEDVKEVRAGLECGIRLGDFNDYEEGDIIECYTLEKIAQTL